MECAFEMIGAPWPSELRPTTVVTCSKESAPKRDPVAPQFSHYLSFHCNQSYY
uniref:Uncharacterized protein n=1 Tax=Setaria viridis TaxID=4556 RepID=A0A4U6V364_SETVI|nr:hypothetical protein SEVIR_4G299101v2 [Setaria viridis]